ncbi:MAG: hypothetical protein K2J42_00880, partial [Muribaculaceae bacterium]|nr:hypothetical protein [Muribaculaceae bacterium]
STRVRSAAAADVHKRQDYDDALDYISKFSRVNRQLMSVVRLTPLPVGDLDRLIVNSMTIDSYINARSQMIANPLQYEH